ncbi:MAG: M3 family metallopeptidase [Bacteroidaceae bacterium]|nr:M3 family metallopeptidase [Bacteroidaceae bacterium]
MKKKLITAAMLLALGTSAFAQNPFLEKRYRTPYEIPPFERITIDHYREGMVKGMEMQKKEIMEIVECKDEPTFENTIAALDRSGSVLNKTDGVWGTLNSSNSTEEMRSLERELSPLESAHSDFIYMNKELFAKVKHVYDNQARMNLNKEQKTLLEKTYKRFVSGGALLSDADKKKLADINKQISNLQLQCTQNLMHDTNNTYVIADSRDELDGLPEANIQQAAQLAKRIGKEGKFAFNMQRPSCNPVLQYCKNRELRRKVYDTYNNRCNHGDKYDNKEISRKVVELRMKKAQLMGYKDFASMQLENRMAQNSANVYDLLNQVWGPAVDKANEEIADIREMMKKDGVKGEPQRWDYMYYLDKAKKAKFNIDEEKISEYLEINNVQQGIFHVANKLYGLTFKERTEDYPQYDSNARSWDVIDKEGNVIAIFYSDYFPRDGKGAGAWCGGFRGQTYDGTQRVQPIVTNVCNMTLPSDGKPALQTIDNVETMFHEFGHAMHAFFRNVQYHGTSSVERDFVELPSQINEHWAFEPEVLKQYARHYKTGEVIPDELIEKIDASSKYGQGFATTELVAASLVDMDLHTMTAMPKKFDVMEFQARKMKERGIPKQILPRYSVTNFKHTIGGGYAAGYYSSLWSEVLDCDAFQAFKETGDIYNQEVARKFREYVLTPGGINTGAEMYQNFRGRQPQVDGLLQNRGLKKRAPKAPKMPKTVKNSDIESKVRK